MTPGINSTHHILRHRYPPTLAHKLEVHQIYAGTHSRYLKAEARLEKRKKESREDQRGRRRKTNAVHASTDLTVLVIVAFSARSSLSKTILPHGPHLVVVVDPLLLVARLSCLALELE